MSSGYVEKIIKVTMNPDELRALADKMEEVFPAIRMADSTFIDYIVFDDKLRVDLYADQDWFDKKTQRMEIEKC